MHDYEIGYDSKGKKYKLYLIAFVAAALIHTLVDFFGLGFTKVTGFRLIGSVLFYVVIFYFGLRRKLWAEFIIKFFIWLNVLILLLIIIVKSLGL
ncbi:hypothetical protein [Planococcus shixiaomingii]|uniref:hypothetical protein n=1 Tax=Planococcus shixiaomingii TaxID=3058393 RepID=UPI002617AE35|nr:hypothetical protein [Planococcus sp. N022]WKA56538.1 hypothetical protein QWY21_09375 [Planococcus sp. N022]